MSIGDLSRVLQGLIAGMEFLLAGTTLQRQAEGETHGLTAAVGVAAGLGLEASAVLGTVLALIILALLPQIKPPAYWGEAARDSAGARRLTAAEVRDIRGQRTGKEGRA